MRPAQVHLPSILAGAGLAVLLLGLASMMQAPSHVHPLQVMRVPAPDRIVSLPAEGGPQNVLLILADDLGIGDLALFGEASDYPSTPNLEQLASKGVSFRNAYSNPICSPTRATILTGRHSFRTGVGTGIPLTGSFPLPAEEILIPEMLDLGTIGLYSHAIIGKWHLGLTHGAQSPNVAGFEYADYRPGNLVPLAPHAHTGGYADQNYFDWWNSEQGSVAYLSGYAPTYTIDSALAWIETAEEPWFVYLPFNTPHGPLHEPPADLHSVDLSGVPPGEYRPYYKAMIEAMDTELGRLFDAIEPLLDHTTIIFVGDNGTAPSVTAPPWDPAKMKGTVYEGGTNVPLIVSSDLVQQPGSFCDALVNTTDFFATVADIAQVDLSSGHGTPVLDSVSLVPYLLDPDLPSIRQHAYCEYFAPNGFGPSHTILRAIRDSQYRLMVLFEDDKTTELFFDLASDPFEQNDLLPGGLSAEQQVAYQNLKDAMQNLLEGD